MDSLTDGYRALVLGASGGIGSAVLAQLRDDPRCAEAVGLSRSGDGMDVTQEPSLARLAGEVGAPVHLLFIATGALEIGGAGPEKAFRQVEPGPMTDQFALNALGPALALKHFGALLPKRERALIGALSARVGSIGDNHIGGWMGYRAAKAALNQILRCAAIELSRTHRKAALAALHPGTVRTPLTEGRRPSSGVLEPEESARRLLDILDGLSPEQSGRFWDWKGEPVEW